MAKWNITPETEGNTIAAGLQYEDGVDGVHYEVRQNVGDILKEVEHDRELLQHGKKQMGWRKAFTVPDVVAVEILNNHGLNLHDHMFMHDRDKMNKLKYIIKTEYPYLLIST